MCKLDDILQTEQRTFQRPVQTRRGLSYDHIEYNTDLLFMFSKKIGKPLDQALDLMRSRRGRRVVNGAYSKRAVKTQRQVVKELCDALV